MGQARADGAADLTRGGGPYACARPRAAVHPSISSCGAARRVAMRVIDVVNHARPGPPMGRCSRA